jgi:cytochrome c biogenesis protein CcmG/thiol:disulfide interchange protein DsbE
MKQKLLPLVAVLAMSFSWNAGAQEKLPLLTVNGESYTNATVTTVTATHLEFKHSRGVASVKLKNLSPELQKQFKFDPAAASAAEKIQAESDAKFRAEEAAKPPVKKKPALAATPDDKDDLVVAKLHAKSFRGQKGPRFQVEQFLTPIPDTKGKFVLVDFWATWCGPCRASIPHLNALQMKFKDRLVVIGLSDETAAEVKAMKSPVIGYFVAVDTKSRMSNEAEVRGIPHAILLDPDGIVRFEGNPGYLDEAVVSRLLDKYSK